MFICSVLYLQCAIFAVCFMGNVLYLQWGLWVMCFICSTLYMQHVLCAVHYCKVYFWVDFIYVVILTFGCKPRLSCIYNMRRCLLRIAWGRNVHRSITFADFTEWQPSMNCLSHKSVMYCTRNSINLQKQTYENWKLNTTWCTILVQGHSE
jgi:hypothetical protein